MGSLPRICRNPQLYSKRHNLQNSGTAPEYIFDFLPNSLKNQIFSIIGSCFGAKDFWNRESSFSEIIDILIREYGITRLIERDTIFSGSALNEYFMSQEDIKKQLDVIELCFQYIDIKLRKNLIGHDIIFDDAIKELNHRFKEHNVGYAFDGGMIVKVYSEYVHDNIISPTIMLINNKKFAGANEEFMKALAHFRAGNNKECLNECSKALESVLKIICIEKKWPIKQNDTAKKLIQICFENNLVPSFTQNQFTSLQSLLESGIPTIRNKLSAHGQGQDSVIVDDDITKYGLSLTGSNILFLVAKSGVI